MSSAGCPRRRRVALIGAVHVDQGVEAGQEAAAYVLRPLLDSVSKLLNNELRDLAGVIHPKQHLYELAADVINIKVIKENKCNSMVLKDAVNFLEVGSMCDFTPVKCEFTLRDLFHHATPVHVSSIL